MASYTQPRPARQPLRALPVLERRRMELELQLVGQRLERQQPRGSARNCLYFSPECLGEFYFALFGFFAKIYKSHNLYLVTLISYGFRENTPKVSKIF